MKDTIKYIAPVLLAAAVGSVNAATVIQVANAGFENPALADGTNNTNAYNTTDSAPTGGNSAVANWTESNAADHITFVLNPGAGFTQATEGQNAAFLQNGSLTQSLSSFTLNAGDTVTVTFDLWSTNAGNGSTFTTNFAGLGVQTATGVAPNGAAAAQSIEFTAISTITSADLVFASTAGGHQYRLDNVAVSFVPEPSSAALLGLGGLALILRRRK